MPAVAALSLIAVIGVGGGAFVGRFLENLPDQPASVHAAAAAAARPARPSPGAIDQALVASAAPPTPDAAEAAAAEAAAEADESTPAPMRLKVKTAPRPAHVSHAPFPALKPQTPQEQWEQKRVDYEIARAAYDANEREEGLRWARQNNVRVPRYCRAAAQPDAFVQGCLSYFRPGGKKAAETPPSPTEERGSDEG